MNKKSFKVAQDQKVNTSTTSSKETEDEQKAAALSGIKRVLHMTRGQKQGTKLSQLKTRVVYFFSYTSAAATAQAINEAVALNSASDIGSFQNIFDEARILGGVVHFNVVSSAATAFYAAAACYDPTDNTALSSVVNALEHSQHIGPLGHAGSGSNDAEPLSHTKTGFWTLKFKVPKGTALAASAAEVGDAWFSLTTPIPAGYVKFYVNAPSGGTSTVNTYTILDVEFRSRT